MTQIWEYIKIALMNIKNNKGRSILTMLGIIIGISSVIMVISIGNGVRGQINSELEGIGSGQIAFYVDSTRKDTTVTFDDSDFDMIEERVEHVKGVTPQFSAWGTAEGPKGDFDINMIGGIFIVLGGWYYLICLFIAESINHSATATVITVS